MLKCFYNSNFITQIFLYLKQFLVSLLSKTSLSQSSWNARPHLTGLFKIFAGILEHPFQNQMYLIIFSNV